MTYKNSECVRVELVEPDGFVYTKLRRKGLIKKTVRKAIDILSQDYLGLGAPITIDGMRESGRSATRIEAGQVLRVTWR
ncbi:MAG: hypothetical protein A2Y57_02375 [Candidatus Woykebacteria bacterium RBG_13_40_7b]|uniref:Uncharacterized protein n=1 Tax=Candidatus Woykebacteria bacterium RBG_13_40_7b TaxID=1802594 RepID=A0A1G1WB90_9BACT|nr:MAG: hypothetical protein A2Y57_02375 [Candidatus Woykebacteria bacterium RBG_13_40_7b]